MGKLGNNLKSTIIVLVAVLAALAALPFAANFFGIKSPAKNGGNNDMEANASEAKLNTSYVTKQPSGTTTFYGGTDRELVNPGTTINSTYWLEYSFDPFPSNDTRAGGTKDYSSIKKKEPGTYTIYVGVFYKDSTGYAKRVNESSFQATITKATLSRDSYVLHSTSPFWGDYVSTSSWTLFPTKGSKVTSIYEPSGATGSVSGGIPTYGYSTKTISGTIQYRYKYTPYVGSVSYSNYVSDYTTLTATNAGDYALYFKLTNDPHYENFEGEVQGLHINSYGGYFEDQQIAYIKQRDTWNLSSTGENVTTTSSTLPYNGNNQTLFTVKADSSPYQSDGGKVYYAASKDGVPATSVTGSAFTKGTALALSGKNAGTYTLYIKQSGYNNIKNKGWTSTGLTKKIEKVTPVVNDNITSKGDLPYSRGNQTLFNEDMTFKHSNSNSTAVDGTVTYGIKKGSGTVGSGLSGKDAATYTAYYTFTPEDTTNYNSITDWTSTNVTNTISPVTPVVKSNSIESTGEKTYNRGSQTLFSGSVTFQHSASDTTKVDGTVTYGIKKGSNSVTSDSLSGDTVATYTAYYKFTPTDTTNYNSISWTSSEVINKINKATPAVKSNSLASKGEKTYNRSSQTLFSGTITWQHSASDTTAVDGTMYYWYNILDENNSYLTGAQGKFDGTQAGLYDLYYYFKPDDTTNYNQVGASGSGEWVNAGVATRIKKATPVVSGNLTASNDTPYTGKSITLFSGSMTFKHSDSDSTAVAGTPVYGIKKGSNSVTSGSLAGDTVATYTAYYKFTPDDTTNYNSITTFQTTGKTAKIIKATGSISATGLSANSSTLTYAPNTTHKPFTGSATKSGAGAGSPWYILSAPNSTSLPTNADTNYKTATSSLTVTAAGTYTLFYKLPEADNCTGTNWQTFGTTKTVNKATVTITGISAITTTRTFIKGTAQTLFTGTASVAGDGTVRYDAALEGKTPSGDGFEKHTDVKYAPAGKYTLYYKVTGCTNYKDVTAWTALKINNAAITKTINQLTATAPTVGSLATKGPFTYSKTATPYLFSGAAASDGDGDFYYTVTKTAIDSTATPTAPASTVTGVKNDATGFTGDVASQYHLWVKTTATSNTTEYGTWTRLVTTKINKAASGLKSNPNNPLKGYTFTYDSSVGNRVLFTGAATSASGMTPTYGWSNGSASTDAPTNTANISTTLSALQQANQGTYYLWYKIDANDNYNGSNWTYAGVSTTINQLTSPSLKVTGLSKITSLKYNGEDKQLFQGSATHVNGDGQIYYTVTTSTTAPTIAITAGQKSTELVKETYGYTSAGAQKTFYLWYAKAGTNNSSQIKWTVLKDSSGNYITNKIDKATLAVDITLNGTSFPYIGQPVAAINSATVTSSTGKTSDWTVTYKLSRTYNFGQTDTLTDSLESLKQKAATAGTFAVQATWVPSSTDTTVQKQFLTGSSTPKTFTINQISDTTKIAVSGLNLNSSLKLDATGSLKPFASTTAIDLTVCGATGNNGITTNNTTNGYNVISWELTQATGTPSSFNSAATAAELNSALKARTVSASGTWYLWFKVVKHANLKTNTIFRASTFTVQGYTVPNSTNLKGLTLLGGSSAVPGTTSFTFNGTTNPIVSGALTTTNNLSLGTVLYAVTKDSAVTPAEGNSAWKSSLSDSTLKKEDKGTYYLHVAWTGSESVVAHAGMLYGTVNITAFNPVQNKSSIQFAGVSFGTDWTTAGANSSTGKIPFTTTFANKDIPVVSAMNPTVSVSGKSNIQISDFGTLSFAVESSDTSTPTSWKSVSEFSSLKVKNQGTSYLWIKWAGTNNITAGSMVYQCGSNARIAIGSDYYIPTFTVQQLTDAAQVSLANRAFATVYNRTFSYTPANGSYQAIPQTLFAGTPSVKVCGADYSASYQYLITNEVTANDSGWSDSIKQMSDVGTYTLSVKVVINDNNVKVQKVIKTTKTAEISQAESFVGAGYAPQAIDNLIANGEPQVLIIASKQTAPTVEYSLNGIDWTSDVEKIAEEDAGTHKVYYRGAAYKNTFYAQTEPAGYIEVRIDMRSLNLTKQPEPLNVVYNGQPQIIFSAGEGDGVLVYSWNNTDFYEYNAEELKQVDAAKYTLFYKIEGDSNSQGTLVESKTCEIKKANVAPKAFNRNVYTLTYKAADYHLFTEAVNYHMLDAASEALIVGGTELNYTNSKVTGWQYGVMGAIKYGVSNAADIVPTQWKEDYAAVVARTVGQYYVWVNIAAGDNHNGVDAICLNENNPIEIQAADVESINLNDTTYSAYKLRYNATAQNLLDNVELVVKVVNRNDNNEIVDADGNQVETLTEAAYNVVPTDSTDSFGSVKYALSETDDLNDESIEWQGSWTTLTKENAAKYYLMVKIETEEGSNLASCSVCLVNAENEIKIDPALKNDIVFAYYAEVDRMYNGEGQMIAGGTLSATINGRDITSLINVGAAEFCYLTNGEEPNENTVWTAWAETKAINAGQYQLFVRLNNVSDNIDSETTPLVYALLESYAEITPIVASQVEIQVPEFATELKYNGYEQDLVLNGTTPQLKVLGTDIVFEEGVGAISYYISSTDENTEGEALTYLDLKQAAAGTYYIWVEFAAGANHEAIAARMIGEVTIAKVSVDDIVMSGINFNYWEYNGKRQDLLTNSSALVQTLSSGYTLSKANGDYENIQFAWSTDTDAISADAEWVDELTSVEAENAGKYYLWIKIINGKNVEDFTKYYSADSFAEINPLTVYSTYIYGITYEDGLVYNAKPQQLVTIQNGLTIKSSTDVDLYEKNKEDLDIEWGLGESKLIAPTEEDWVDAIDKIQGENGGDYFLWIKSKGNNNIATFEMYLGIIKIDQATIEFVLPGVNDAIVYNGAPRDLLNSPAKTQFDGVEGLEILYSVNGNEPSADISTVTGINAGTYIVTCIVEETQNWKRAEIEIPAQVATADAFEDGMGGIFEVVGEFTYNETSQDLITAAIEQYFHNSQAASEGSIMVFSYTNDFSNQYKYHYDETSGGYWDEITGKMPGQVNAMDYTVYFYVTESESKNYHASDRKMVTTSINKRAVEWQLRPQAKTDLQYNGEAQEIITAGTLNLDPVPAGVKVQYTISDPVNNMWGTEIPAVTTSGLYRVWYRVQLDENHTFVNAEVDNPENGTVLFVNVVKCVLSVIKQPEAITNLIYNAEMQKLVSDYQLSTDSDTTFSDKPRFEFSLDNLEWVTTVEARDQGEYTVYYQLVYNSDLFEYNGQTSGEIKVRINALTIEPDSVQVVYDYATDTVGYEVIDGLYSADLISEFEFNIQYAYRKLDAGEGEWKKWINYIDHISQNDLGNYEFKLMIEGNANFNDYTSYTQFSVTADRVIEVFMEENTNAAKIRAWIDFTGTTSYEDAEYKQENTLTENSARIVFNNVASMGEGNAYIRVEVIESGRHYFYMTNNTLTTEDKLAIDLNATNINATLSFDLKASVSKINLYLYEVYNISYDANGGNGEISQGWKWHNVDFQLAENTFTKQSEFGEEIAATGWNTSEAGNGDNYDNQNGLVYSVNASQVFYAIYPEIESNTVLIEWVIMKDTIKYAVSRDLGLWFDTAKYPSRLTGVLVEKGAIITLPQIQTNEDGELLSEIFNGHILSWSTMEGLPYSIGMKAETNMVFVAELNDNVADYIECKFMNEDNEEIHTSGYIANGAQAYMALSGLNTQSIEEYAECYNSWIASYGATTLVKPENSEDGVLNYEFGVKDDEIVPPSTDTVEKASQSNNGIMFVMIGGGVGGSAIAMVVYFIIRRKRI